MSSPSPWLTSREAADYCKRTYSAFRTLACRRRIPSIGTPRKRLYLRRDLDIALGVHSPNVRRFVA